MKDVQLIGTEKQAKWATDIRNRIIEFSVELRKEIDKVVVEQIAIQQRKISDKQQLQERIAAIKDAQEKCLAYIDEVVEPNEAQYYINKFADVRETSSANSVFFNVFDEKVPKNLLKIARGRVWSEFRFRESHPGTFKREAENK